MLCGLGVLAIFAAVATGARDLTLMYGGFLGWLVPLGLFGAVGGAITALLAYLAVKLAALTERRKAITGSVFLATLIVSFAAGFVGASQSERYHEAEMQRAVEECEEEGGTFDSGQLSCTYRNPRRESK